MAGSLPNACVRVESASVYYEVTQDVRVPGLAAQVPLSASAAVPDTCHLTGFVKPFVVIVVQHAYL